MDDSQFQQLMDEIKKSQREVEGKLTSSISELKQEVNSVQERTSRELAQKITKSSYQFKRKGNEIQYNFNSGIEEAISTAKEGLKKIKPSDDKEKESLQKVNNSLDEGIKAIEKRQKHIKVADSSEFGWTTVQHYDSNPLAENAEDEKRLEKAEKDAERESAKRRRDAGAKRRRNWTTETAGPSNKRGQTFLQTSAPPPLMPHGQGQPKPRVLGPCYRCGGFGHLVATCPVKDKSVYPLCQPVVSSAEVSVVSDTSVCVDNTKVEVTLQVVSKQSVNDKLTSGDLDDSEECVLTRNDDATQSDEFISKFWEVEVSDTPSQVTDVQGRLKNKLSFWRNTLQAPPWVIDCIENGYCLPLKYLPPPYSQSNHRSAELHHAFVDEAVQSLVLNRCAVRVGEKPYMCNPLSVVSNATGKLRLVLNLRYLNQFLHVSHFKYEDLRVAALMFEKHDYLFKFDLKSGYHHIDIHVEHQKYLGFQWDAGTTTEYYVFTVLPFGLSTACYLFTKVMRPLVRLWRARGLKAIVYLDDGIVAVKGKREALEESQRVKKELESAGFVINLEKSQWDPSVRIEWLGFLIDLNNGEFMVPEQKISSLNSQLCEVTKGQLVTARQLASVVGKIMSMSLALGPVTRLMTRSLYAVLNSRTAWCQKLALTPEALQELRFWLDEISKFNGQHIWPKPSAVRVVYSDASATGYGGYTVEHGTMVATGQWSTEDALQSSTWRELRAVRLVLESFQSKLENERVRWFTDNQNVVRVVQYGSRQPALQAEALKIFSACVTHHIHMEPEWIPREQNELADYYSRLVDYDDWMLNPDIFNWLDNLWGPHTVDRFANAVNAQLPRFNSRFWVPVSDAIDTFTCNWADDNNWWCPPIYLIPRVIRHAQGSKAKGTLIIPQWPSSPFWPLLFPDGITPANFVVGRIVLPSSETLFLPGFSGANLFKGVPNTPVLALRLEFQ